MFQISKNSWANINLVRQHFLPWTKKGNLYQNQNPSLTSKKEVYILASSKNTLLSGRIVQKTTLPTLVEEEKLVLESEAIINIRERGLRSRIIKEYTLLSGRVVQKKMLHGKPRSSFSNIQHCHALGTKHLKRRGQCYI